MSRRSWNSLNMFCKIFFITMFSHHTFGLDSLDGAKNSRTPFYTTDSDSILTTLESPNQGTPMMYFPTFDENSEDFLVPDLLFAAESDADIVPQSSYDLPRVVKRPNIKFIPRIGRKKRSVSDEMSSVGKNDDQAKMKMSETEMGKPQWNEGSIEDFVFDNIQRRARGKAVFIPRIGKRDYDELRYQDKRVVFIPRIGRGSFMPSPVRVNPPQYRKTSKAIFIPRIG